MAYTFRARNLETAFNIGIEKVTGVFAFPQRKSPTEFDFPEEDGVHAFVKENDITWEPRDIKLYCHMNASTIGQFYDRLTHLRSELYATGLGTLFLNYADNQFQVYYRGDDPANRLLTRWSTSQNVGQFVLSFREPNPSYPAVWRGLTAQFKMDSSNEVLGTNIISVPASDSTFSSCTPGANNSNWVAYNTSTLGAGTGFITFVKTAATGGIHLAPGDLTGETRHRTYKIAGQLKSSTATANVFYQIGLMASADESVSFSINSTLTTYTKYLQAGTVASVGVYVGSNASSSGKTITADNVYVYPVSHDDEASATDGVLYMGSGGAVAYATDRASVANGALDFDGVNDYIDTGRTFQDTFRDSFSVAFWCKPDDGQPGSSQILFGASNSSNEDNISCFLLSTGVLRLYFESNDNVARADWNTALTNGAQSWMHISFIVDNNRKQIDIYINGAKQALDSTNNGDLSGIVIADYANVNNLYIGAKNSAGTVGSFFAGSMHDFRIYDRALSGEEVKVLYHTYPSGELDY